MIDSQVDLITIVLSKAKVEGIPLALVVGMSGLTILYPTHVSDHHISSRVVYVDPYSDKVELVEEV